eukprot:8936781-Karenia_brevis.AAC.1
MALMAWLLWLPDAASPPCSLSRGPLWPPDHYGSLPLKLCPGSYSFLTWPCPPVRSSLAPMAPWPLWLPGSYDLLTWCRSPVCSPLAPMAPVPLWLPGSSGLAALAS